MASSTSYLQGREFYIYVGSMPIGCSKTATIEVTSATSDSTTKCDVVIKDGKKILFTNNTPQAISWTLTDNGVVPVTVSGVTPEVTLTDLLGLQLSQTLVYAAFQDANSGIFYGGDAWITSVKATASTTEDLTYDVTLTGVGELSPIPVS